MRVVESEECYSGSGVCGGECAECGGECIMWLGVERVY